jgi:hypothetical protein
VVAAEGAARLPAKSVMLAPAKPGSSRREWLKQIGRVMDKGMTSSELVRIRRSLVAQHFRVADSHSNVNGKTCGDIRSNVDIGSQKSPDRIA